MGVNMEPHRMDDIVAILRTAGLSDVTLNRSYPSAEGSLSHCAVRCLDERNSAPWEKKGVQLIFVPRDAPMWSLSIHEVQRLLGVKEEGTLICSLADAAAQLTTVLQPLNSTLAQFDGKPKELDAAIRKARFRTS